MDTHANSTHTHTYCTYTLYIHTKGGHTLNGYTHAYSTLTHILYIHTHPCTLYRHMHIATNMKPHTHTPLIHSYKHTITWNFWMSIILSLLFLYSKQLFFSFPCFSSTVPSYPTLWLLYTGISFISCLFFHVFSPLLVFSARLIQISFLFIL